MRIKLDDSSTSAGPSPRSSAADGWERWLAEALGPVDPRRCSRCLDRRHVAQRELLDRLLAHAELLHLPAHGHGEGVD